MAKPIKILLSREAFEELENIREQCTLTPYETFKRKTYEEYLKEEEKEANALFG